MRTDDVRPRFRLLPPRLRPLHPVGFALPRGRLHDDVGKRGPEQRRVDRNDRRPERDDVLDDGRRGGREHHNDGAGGAAGCGTVLACQSKFSSFCSAATGCECSSCLCQAEAPSAIPAA